MNLDTSAMVGTLWSSAGRECSGCKSLASACLPPSAQPMKCRPANRSQNHAPRPPAFARHHTRINFDGKAAEPKPSSSQRRGRAALGSNARAPPQPVSDPPGGALKADRLPARAPMEEPLDEAALAAELHTRLAAATQRYEKERGAKPPLPQLPPSNETGSLHLFLGSAPRATPPPVVARRKTTKKKPVKPETLPYVGPYRAFTENDDFTHIKTDRKHRVVREVERPKTPEICVDKPDEWANFELPEGFDLQKWLAEDPEQYDEWLLYHKGLGPKPVKHVVSDEAKALLASSTKVDLGELADEAVPRFPVTSKMELEFNDDASVSSVEEEEVKEVVEVKAKGLKALKQRLSAMSHLRSFAANDPGPGTTTYKLEEDARRFVGAGARKRFFGRLRLCHQQREIVPANVVHVKEYGDEDTVETTETTIYESSEESTLGTGTTADGRRRLKELTLINMPKPEDDSVVTEEQSLAISYTTWQTPSGDVDDNLLTREAMTPRQRFLREVLRKKALPYPVLCRRRPDAPNTLDLTGAGVGDVIIESLAQVLDGLHDVDTLLLADNRLTDQSLDPLLEAVASLPHLTSLDLSGAKMDESSAKLREYLASPSCALTSLVMSRADVDDWECADFCASLQSNASLTSLSLSENLIGDAEALNSVQPDLETGGEALASMLRSNKHVTYLDVSWNKIRRDSAQDLAESLSQNETLTTLNVAHNAFCDLPGQYLGISLASNNTLLHLNLSYNSLSPQAAIVIASAFATNTTLHYLSVAGNPLGRTGAEALITALRRHQTESRFLHIDFANADVDTDLGARGGGVQFSSVDPTGRYRLDMRTPYSQMIARKLYELASTRMGCSFAKCVWSFKPPEPEVDEEEEKKEKKKEEEEDPMSKGRVEFTFKRKCVKKGKKERTSLSSHETDSQRPWYDAVMALYAAVRSREKDLHGYILECLKSMGLSPDDACLSFVAEHFDKSIAKDVDGVLSALFFALFDGIDEDRSEAIDVRELQRGLQHLGCVDSSLEAATRIVESFDSDESGTIEREEFVQWSLAKFLAKPPAVLPELLDAETNKEWKIPNEGGLDITFVAEPHPPSYDMCCTNLGNDGFVRNLELCQIESDRTRLFERAVANTDVYFTCYQAQKLLDVMSLDLFYVVEKLLPVMASTDDACLLLEKNLSLDQRVRLRETMGPLYDAVTGSVSGFYSLDLRDPRDKLCARKLCEINNAQSLTSKSSNRGDTSQKGDWSNYRNEFYEGKPLTLSSSFFADCPMRGRLKFDFVSTRRPKRSTKALSTKRFLSLCKVLGLGELSRVSQFYESMNPLRRNRASFYHGGDARIGVGSRKRDYGVEIDEEDDTSIPEEERADAMAWRAERRKEDAVAEAQQLDERRASYRRASVARTETPSFEDDSTTDEESDDDARVKMRRSTSILACELPWYLKRRDVVSSWRAYKQSTYLVTEWLPAEKARPKGKDKKKKGGKKNEAPVVEEEASHSDSEGEPRMDDFEVCLPVVQSASEAAKSMPCRAYGIVHHRLALLRVATTSLWLSTEQIEFIIRRFPAHDFCRVYACVILHARCLDLENFYSIFKWLEPREQHELVHRLGWLNCMNPVHPERVYVLDLRRYEDREMCKVLVKLAVEEPGSNWCDEGYRWSIKDPYVPGWELPADWASDDKDGEGGPRRFGRLRLRYTSDKSKGCDPKWAVRRALMEKFLCGEALEF